MELTADFLSALADKIRVWNKDGILFVREVFGAEPDRWQAEGLRAWTSDDPIDRRIAFQACAGPGKSTELAWFAWHFLLCKGDKKKHPNAYAVSITADNLRDNLWKELAVWRNRSPLLQGLFEWQKEQIFAKHHPETWWMRARAFSKSADAEAQGRTLSGLHSPYIAYFLDETGDMPVSLLRTAEQGLGNCEWGKIAMAGNPTSMSGALYAAANSSRFHVQRITGDPDNPNRSTRIDIEWARQQIQELTRDNPWVKAFILGEFPPASFNALLGPDDVRAAMERGIKEESYNFAQKRLGIDVARFGDDKTVIFPRQGLRAFRPVEMRSQRGDAIAARIAEAKKNWNWETAFIDDTGGWGAGTIDACRLGGIHLIPVNASSKTVLDPRYFNKRSENQFKAAEWIKNGGCLPYMPELIPEFTATTYTFRDGKMWVEEKAMVKAQLQGRSPDYWDAFCLTFSLPDMPAQMLSPEYLFSMQGNKARTEYDPLAAA